MEETTTLLRDEAEQKQETQKVLNPFGEENWNENNSPIEEKVEEKIEEQKEAIIEKKEEEVKVSNWFEDLGFTTADEAKAQVVELKKLKDNPTKEELKFANEQSKFAYDYLVEGKEDELFDLLSKKKQIERLTVGEVTEKNAADIVKLSMQQKYKEFSLEDIEYKFKKQFIVGKEPEQKITEDNDDFADRHNEWEQKVEEAKKDLLIEAKIARPELEKLKQELVLSNIGKGVNAEDQKLQNQKELDEIAKRRDVYLNSLNADYKNFNGFDTVYKSEGVEIPVSFTITDEEKSALKTELETFDVDNFIVTRWFNQDGTPNVKNLMSDVYQLRNRDKINQKLVNEVGVKVLDNYKQSIKKTNVTGAVGASSFNPSDTKSEVSQMADSFFSQNL